MFSKADQNSGLQGRLTDHSDCKICISRFLALDTPGIYVTQLSAWLPEHDKSQFIPISIHSTSAKYVVNNDLLSKCPANKCKLEFPYAQLLSKFIRKNQLKVLPQKVISRTGANKPKKNEINILRSRPQSPDFALAVLNCTESKDTYP